MVRYGSPVACKAGAGSRSCRSEGVGLRAATAFEAAPAQFDYATAASIMVGRGKAVNGGSKFEPALVPGPAQVALLAAGTDRVDPAERRIYPLALALTAAVARVWRGARSIALRRP